MKIGAWEASLDLYDVLGVRRDATAEQIRSAYRRRIFDTHPDMRDARDRGIAEARTKRINLAGAILLDPALRRRYDALRAARVCARSAASGRSTGADARCGDFWPFGHVVRPEGVAVAEVHVPPPPPIGGLAATCLLAAGFVLTFGIIAWLAAPIPPDGPAVTCQNDVHSS